MAKSVGVSPALRAMALSERQANDFNQADQKRKSLKWPGDGGKEDDVFYWKHVFSTLYPDKDVPPADSKYWVATPEVLDLLCAFGEAVVHATMARRIGLPPGEMPDPDRFALKGFLPHLARKVMEQKFKRPLEFDGSSLLQASCHNKRAQHMIQQDLQASGVLWNSIDRPPSDSGYETQRAFFADECMDPSVLDDCHAVGNGDGSINSIWPTGEDDQRQTGLCQLGYPSDLGLDEMAVDDL